jgi:universal stress protein E
MTTIQKIHHSPAARPQRTEQVRTSRLLHATDLLPKSEAALERAGLLADELGAQLKLLHVAAPLSSEHALEQTLRNAITNLRARTRAPQWLHSTAPSIAVRTGNPSRIILETAKESQADLLILGPHRKRGLRDALEGTLAEKALTARCCPLLIVQQAPREAYNNVLLALDLSATSIPALRASEALVLGPRSRATVVHGYEPPYQGMLGYAGVSEQDILAYGNSFRRSAAQDIRDLLRKESKAPERYDVWIGESHPAPAILRAVEMHRPDLLVLGTHARHRVGRALLGSVANHLLNLVDCDVLVVPKAAPVQH